jgi:hypothetical protein
LKPILAVLATLGALMTNSAVAKDDHSANYYLPACRDFADRHAALEPFLQGECVGILEGLATLAPDAPFSVSRSCVPDDVTLIQMTNRCSPLVRPASTALEREFHGAR